MRLEQKLSGVLYNLRIPELRFLYVIICIILVLVAVSLFAIKSTTWLLVVLGAVITSGIILMWHEYKNATKRYGERVSRGRLESIITNLEDAVIAYNNNFKVLVFNAAAEKIFGLNKSQVVGQTMGPQRAGEKGYQTLTQTLFPSLAPAVISQTEPNKYPQIVDISFDNPTRELRVSTDRIVDSTGNLLGFVKVVRDRTRETELVRSKSDFVSVAAHQLRTPLTAIKWTLEGLAKNPSIPDSDKQLVENGLQAASSLLKTANDLLSAAEIEGGRFGYNYVETDIIEFIEKILANAQVVAKEYGLQVFFDKGGLREMKLMIDPNRLNIAISNLVDNAMKYNSKGGSVTVRLKETPPNPYVQISVEDTGIGILPSDINNIFTKFYRAPNARKVKADGTGLGLYIARNIIRQHGGDIGVESTLGRGTTFSFTLPTDPTLIPKAEGAFGM